MATDSELRALALKLWKPPPKLSLSEWADEYAYLSAESAAEAGKWKTLPYQREVMDAFTDPSVETVVWMKSARVGATKIFNHLIGYHIHQDPCPIMVCQPTVEDAEGYSKDEIAPMIRDTPVLQGLVSDPKAKDGSNTILAKTYPGGTLGMVGANSARGFRRVSRRVVLFDEVDGYPASTSEGDQIKLGIKRSEYYWNRKIGLCSTPTTKGFSRIERWFLRTDQRRYFVPCPECGHHQVLRWPQMKWEPGRPETASYECDSCGVLIPHSKKRWMVERGEWRATAKAEAPGLVGFHLWAAYSFSPNASWEQLVREFLEVKGDRDQLRTFVNTTLGEPFEDEYAAKLSAEGLLARSMADPYKAGVVPEGGVLLVGAVDVQDTWLEVSIYAAGLGEELWLVWHQKIEGDPAQDDVWRQLDTIRTTRWSVAGGGTLGLTYLAVDTGGHFTSEVYNYCRTRGNGVVPVKGSSTRNAPPLGRGNKVDINYKGRTVRKGLTLYMIGTDALKSTVYARLRFTDPGPGYIHFGELGTEEFLKGLTSERLAIRHVKGFPVREWVKPSGARNEPLDLLVYSLAMVHLTYRRFNRATMWSQLAEQLERQRGRDVATPPTAALKQATPRRRAFGMLG
jgi:terminase, large subunit